MIRSIILSSLFCFFAACSGGGSSEQSTSSEDKNPSSNAAQSSDELASSENGSSQGKSVYNKYCLVCHQSNGEGVPGLYPPLNETDWVNGDKERLIKLVLNGQEGPIEVNGESYNNVMPAQNFLSDEEVAAVLTYVRTNFGNDSGPVTVEEVSNVRKKLQQES